MPPKKKAAHKKGAKQKEKETQPPPAAVREEAEPPVLPASDSLSIASSSPPLAPRLPQAPVPYGLNIVEVLNTDPNKAPPPAAAPASLQPPAQAPAFAPKGRMSLAPPEKDIVVFPSEDQLLSAQRFGDLADQLSRSLVVLRTRIASMEQRAQQSGAAAVLPFQIRRARAEKEQLTREIRQTERAIKKLLLMSEQMEKMKAVREEIVEETRGDLMREVTELRNKRNAQVELIRAGYIERINMLQRYWPWRQLRELGDTSVGYTFEEELARGPRFRHIGIQNNIQFDYISQQLRWVSELVNREESFRNHLRHLDRLVEDLNDINELLQSSLTCSICHLLYENPVLFWPCGHTFCQVCFDSLAIAPSLYRCPTCGSIGSEGFVHNLLVGDTVSKWMFKDAGYGDLQEPLNKIRLHLSRFRKQRMESKIAELKQLIQEQKQLHGEQNVIDNRSIDITYRAF
ncbi:hypothetical protein STCU_00849 [Strigomonas culicis]|nr:hypothetical protein STCU_00849 [Strigomonas culicis]|eukprot:EPY35912.1 hypothetical protein STCU_00849 [Strigomonas culicis]